MSLLRRSVSLALFAAAFAAVCSAQVDQSLLAGFKWRSVGPGRGGRSITATGVPGQPGVYYFGSVGGGLWKTTDGGMSWEPIFDSQPIASIGAVAVAPSDPNVIYVGSGEADMRSAISYGNGMYKSTDAGKTWTHIGLEDTRQIGRVLIDPKNPDVVFVAALGHAYGPNAQRGVFRSKDGGKTWDRVLFKDENTGAIDMAFDPADSKVIYASLWQTRRPPWNVYPPSNGPGSGLYKSTDGGGTWAQLTKGIPTEGLGKIGIAVSPANHNRVYLVVDAKDGGLYRSDDAGASFARTDSEQRIWGRGWYFSGVTADPKNADVIYVCNTSTYRSTNGGVSFTAIKGAPGGDDYHSLWIAPEDPDRMILSSDQGTVVSLNGGKTWTSWYNQPTAQIYHVAVDNRFPYWIYGAQQDSGAIAVPSRSNFGEISERDWKAVGVGGESGSLAIDPATNTPFGGTVSKFDWETFQDQNVSPTAGKAGTFRNTWTLPLVFSPADKKTLYVSHQYLWSSADGGNTWKQISPDLTREDPGVPANLDPITAKYGLNSPRKGVIYAIAPSPVDAKLIWVGTDDGLIHMTHDAGAHWTNVTPPQLTPWSKVGIIEASRYDANTAYAAIDRHRLEDYKPYIYRTRDGGKSWQVLSNGIPEGSFVNAVREDPVRKGLLYAGTELGVYVSFDDGDHWQPLQTNLPATSVRDLVIHDDDLIVGTHGRGFWVLDDISALREMNAQLASEPAHLFKPRATLRVRPGSDQGTPYPPEIARGENPPAGAILYYSLEADSSEPVTLEILDSKGGLVRKYSSADQVRTPDEKTLEIPMYWVKPAQPPAATKGMHRFVWDMRYTTTQQGGRGGFSFFAGSGGLWAPPGEYTVRLTAGGKTYTQPLTLKKDPRVKASDADLLAQYASSKQADDDVAQLAKANAQATAIRKQLNEAQQKGSNAALKDFVTATLKQLDEVAGAPPAGGFGTPSMQVDTDSTSLRHLNSAIGEIERAMQSADAAPTTDQKQTLAANEQVMRQTLASWNNFLKQQVPAINQKLQGAGLEQLKFAGLVPEFPEGDDDFAADNK